MAAASLAFQAALDRLRGVDAGLHRDLGDAREIVVVHHVADGEDLGVPGQRAVGQDLDAARPVAFGAAGVGEHAGER